jgi:hypothetical protein
MEVPDGTETELRALEALAGRISNLDLLKGAPPEFNVFEAVGVVFQEVRHSDFLAFLLDPRSNHGLGDRFAKGWLTRVVNSARSGSHEDNNSAAPSVGPALLERMDHIDLSRARVYREKFHMDVLLVDQTNRLVVVVENKIFSGEHSDQLPRYREVIGQYYSGFDPLCIYLTPAGDLPSHPDYLPTDYELLCEEVEGIVREALVPDGIPIDDEVKFALTHYARLLRRNIVVNSEVANLARKLYLEHRKAFELVYAHRYSHQKQLREVLISLVKGTRGLVYQNKVGNPPEERILFYPKDWDVPVLRRGREDYGGTLILRFEFENFLDRLNLKLQFGRGDDEVRRWVLEMAHEDRELFAAAPLVLDPEWGATIWKMPLLTREDYLECTYLDLEHVLRERWSDFLKGPFRHLSETVRSQEWMQTDAT